MRKLALLLLVTSAAADDKWFVAQYQKKEYGARTTFLEDVWKGKHSPSTGAWFRVLDAAYSVDDRRIALLAIAEDANAEEAARLLRKVAAKRFLKKYGIMLDEILPAFRRPEARATVIAKGPFRGKDRVPLQLGWIEAARRWKAKEAAEPLAKWLGKALKKRRDPTARPAALALRELAPDQLRSLREQCAASLDPVIRACVENLNSDDPLPERKPTRPVTLLMFDVSSRMRWPAYSPHRIDVARRRVAAAIKAIPDGQYFRLATFAGHVNVWRRELVPASEDTRADALAWLDRAELVRGSCNALHALMAPARMKQVNRVQLFVGAAPSAGEESAALILAHIRQLARTRTLVYDVDLINFGPSQDERDRGEYATALRLYRAVAEQTGGKFQHTDRVPLSRR